MRVGLPTFGRGVFFFFFFPSIKTERKRHVEDLAHLLWEFQFANFLWSRWTSFFGFSGVRCVIEIDSHC